MKSVFPQCQREIFILQPIHEQRSNRGLKRLPDAADNILPDGAAFGKAFYFSAKDRTRNMAVLQYIQLNC